MKPLRPSSLFWAAAPLLVGAVAALAINLGAIAAIGTSGNRATEALLRVETLFSTVKDAESGGRGYLLTGDEAFLDSYPRAIQAIGDDLAAAEAVVATDPERRRRLEAIAALAEAKLRHMQWLIELRRGPEGADAALAAIATGEGRRLMAALREEVSALQQVIIRDRDAEQGRAWWRATGSAGLAMLTLGLAVVVLRRRLAGRERSIEALLAERAGEEFERISAGVLLDALPVGVLLADASGRIVRANAEAARLWGGRVPGTPGDPEGEGGRQGWSVETGAPLAPADWPLARALRTGVSCAGEAVRIRRRDGGEAVILETAAPVRDAAGRLLGAVSIAQDITGRQREQDRRREAEAQYRAIVETAEDAIATIDEAGIIQSFNPAAERIFGYAAAEIIGRSINTLMPERAARIHDHALARYADSSTRHVRWNGRELTARRRDGTEFPIELSLAEWRTSAGERRFTGLMRDLSERRRAEAALRESDRRVRELQAEFLHMARMSEIGQMAATLAHELNQPLAAVANYINGSRRLLDGAEAVAKLPMVRQALASAAQQAIHAGQIIRRMRSFVGRGDADKRIEDLRELAEGAAELVSLAAKQRRVELRLDLGQEGLRVLADRTQVQQVLVNLMHNAIEAMEGSERRLLTITARPLDAEMVEIAVADTGPGIPAEIAADLFKSFVTTKRSGMGVGLSVCRTIVEEHGGRIWTEPNPGGGTVFRFTLPAAPAPEEKDAAPASPTAAPSA